MEVAPAINNTLMSLMALMALVWSATQGIKFAVPKIPQDLVALILGQATTIVFWKAGIMKLDGADHLSNDPWTYSIVVLYGLLAYGMAAKSHDIGQNPRKLIQRTKDGTPVGR